jgi:dsRNA-specific ribonuclease
MLLFECRVDEPTTNQKNKMKAEIKNTTANSESAITSSVKICRESGSYKWEVSRNGKILRVGYCTSKEKAERHAAESIGSLILF